MSSPEVELLWWAGCPSTDRARTELREALDELGLARADIREVEITADEHAGAAAFVGSPTIRINGVDVAPPEAGEPVGLTCRVYHLRDGRISPTPDPDDLRAALRRATADSSAPGGRTRRVRGEASR